MEYYFPGVPGIGKKSRDTNTGQNDTGTRDPGTEPLVLMSSQIKNTHSHQDTPLAHILDT